MIANIIQVAINVPSFFIERDARENGGGVCRDLGDLQQQSGHTAGVLADCGIPRAVCTQFPRIKQPRAACVPGNVSGQKNQCELVGQ